MRTQADVFDRLFNFSEKRLARILLLMAEFVKPGKSEMSMPPIAPEATALLESAIRAGIGVRIQPQKQSTGAAGRHRDAFVRCAVIKVNRVSILANRLSAGKYDVVDIPFSFIPSFRTKYPGVSSL
jgi:hypothetical protein